VAADFNILLRAKDQASAAIKKVKGEFVDLNGVIDKHEKALKRAGVAGAVVVAGLAAMTKGAATQQRTQRQLAAALDNVGVSYASVGDELERVIAVQQTKTGVSDEDQRESLRILVGTLGSYEKAVQALPAVLDAAAFAGTGLRETSKTLSRALAGNVNTAESVGITFDKTADFGERLSQVLDVAGGQAESSRDPFDALLNSLSDIGDEIGTAFLPLAEKAANAVGRFAEFLGELDEGTLSTIAAIAGGAGLTLALAGLIPLIAATTVALGGMSVASALATGGLTVLAGLAAAGALKLAMDDLIEPIGDVNVEVATLGTESESTAESAKNAADALDLMTDATEKMEKSAADAADKSLRPLRESIDDVLVATGQVASVEDVGLRLADMFGLLSNVELDGRPIELMGRYGTAMSGLGDRIEQLRPEIREGFADSLKEAVGVLGITARDIEAKGGDVDAALGAAFEGLDEEGAETFKRLVDGIGEELALLDPSTAFLTAKEKAVAGAEALAEETLPVVTTFVDAAIAKADELVPAFEAVGEGLPFALAAGINKMSGVLEFGFNDVVLSWLRQAMEQLNEAALSLGAQIPFQDIGGALPPGIDLPDVPAFARGVRNFSGGAAFVGENGTELVNLPRGSSVTPADQLMRVVDSIDQLGRSGALAMGSDLPRLARGGLSNGAGVAALGGSPGLDAFGRASGATSAGSAGRGAFANYGTIQITAASDAQSREILDAMVAP